MSIEGFIDKRYLGYGLSFLMEYISVHRNGINIFVIEIIPENLRDYIKEKATKMRKIKQNGK